MGGKTVLIADVAFANKGERKSDIAIATKGNNITIFIYLNYLKNRLNKWLQTRLKKTQ